MKLSYTISTAQGSIRTIHNLTINDEAISTTRAKEVLLFAKPRIASKSDWKYLKDAIRLGTALEINGGE